MERDNFRITASMTLLTAEIITRSRENATPPARWWLCRGAGIARQYHHKTMTVLRFQSHVLLRNRARMSPDEVALFVVNEIEPTLTAYLVQGRLR